MDPLAGEPWIGLWEHEQVIGDVGRYGIAGFQAPPASDRRGVLAAAVEHDDRRHRRLGRIGRDVNVVRAIAALDDQLVGENGHRGSSG